MIAPAELRAAKALVAADRKAKKRARPARVIPEAAGQRQPRKRDPGYLAFLRRLPCAVGPIGCEGPTQAAHLRSGRPGAPTGLGIKPDDKWATPLCARHHALQHSVREGAFWALNGIIAGDLCIALHAAYLSGQDGEEIVRRAGG